MYKNVLKPILFLFDPELVHHFVFKMIKLIHFIPGVGKIIRWYYRVDDPSLNRKVFGLNL